MNKDINTFRKYPLLPLCIAFILGIVLANNIFTFIPTIYWCVLLVMLVASLLIVSHRPTFSKILIIIALLFGAITIRHYEYRHTVTLTNKTINYDAVVLSKPTEKPKSITFNAYIFRGQYEGKTIQVYIPKTKTIHLNIGSAFNASSVYRPFINIDFSSKNSNVINNSIDKNQINNINNNNTKPTTTNKEYHHTFDYAQYMYVRDIIANTYIRHRDIKPMTISMSRLPLIIRLRIRALIVRQTLIDSYKKLGAKGEWMSVVAAMTLGDKSSLEQTTRDIYSSSGASHVLALSGLHIGIIYSLFSIFIYHRRRNIASTTILLLAIWMYVFIVGLPLSVIRAAVMITVCSLASITGRSGTSLNTLSFTALAMLVVSPVAIYDIGFQLSFLAVFGIFISINNVIGIIPNRFQQRHRILKKIWQLSVISMAAQVMTAPLVAHYFGSLPIYFLLTNLVVIPAATIIIYLSLLVMTLSFIPALQQFFLSFLAASVIALNHFLSLISALPCSSIKIPYFSVFSVCLSYIVIVVSFIIANHLAHYISQKYNLKYKYYQ